MADGIIAADQLRLFCERIERLNEEIKGLNEDKRDVYGEAKSMGFDGKALKELIRLRSMETHTRQEWDAVVETYRQAVGLG